MSFSDFGKRPASSRPAAVPASSSRSPSQDGLSSISETLLQYQRNVGILEKIVQSLTARKNSLISSQNNELGLQYKAQLDVLAQLQEKIQRLLKQYEQKPGSESQKTTLTKLKNDFERVQKRVATLQDAVERLEKQQKQQQQEQLKSATYTGTETSGGASQMNSPEEQAHQIQMQMQEDRLHEEIMREREQEIRNINRGMHQVNEIYKDLAHIVGSQQEQIDSIENQMEESKVNAESGLKQVEQANEKYGSGNCVIS